MKISIFWFRRDLRLEDNTALNLAISKNLQVLPIFIFDTSVCFPHFFEEIDTQNHLQKF